MYLPWPGLQLFEAEKLNFVDYALTIEVRDNLKHLSKSARASHRILNHVSKDQIVIGFFDDLKRVLT